MPFWDQCPPQKRSMQATAVGADQVPFNRSRSVRFEVEVVSSKIRSRSEEHFSRCWRTQHRNIAADDLRSAVDISNRCAAIRITAMRKTGGRDGLSPRICDGGDAVLRLEHWYDGTRYVLEVDQEIASSAARAAAPCRSAAWAAACRRR
jgi:hypothetical protein